MEYFNRKFEAICIMVVQTARGIAKHATAKFLAEMLGCCPKQIIRWHDEFIIGGVPVIPGAPPRYTTLYFFCLCRANH